MDEESGELAQPSGDNPNAAVCPRCRKSLQTTGVARRDDLSACALCGKRIRTDDRYHQAIALATANEGWVEKTFWAEPADDLLGVLFVLLVDGPLTVLKFVGPICLLLSLYLVRGPDGLPWSDWVLFPTVGLAVFVALWAVKRVAERLFANRFVAEVNFLVCSRGIVLLSHLPRPVLLPWSSIRSYGWTSNVESMTSQMVIEYATADGGVAQVVLQGEETRQPLGEVVEILDARLGGRQ